MNLFNWFHHLFQPHCSDCKSESACQTCDTLKELLEKERHEKSKLLELIVQMNSPTVEPVSQGIEIKDWKPRPSWKEKQRILEEQDRKKAILMKEKTEELEKEVI